MVDIVHSYSSQYVFCSFQCDRIEILVLLLTINELHCSKTQICVISGKSHSCLNGAMQDMMAESTNGNDKVLETHSASCSPGNEQLEENKDASQQGQKQTCWAAASGLLGTSLVSEMNQSVI